MSALPKMRWEDDLAASDWRQGLPVLRGTRVALRELRPSDAAELVTLLNSDDVLRFISPPPATAEEFGQFITWTHRQRAAGAYACFAITVKEHESAIGIFQLRETEPSFATAEWGFALGSDFWGSGLFSEGAELVLEFAFGTLGVHQLEARAAVRNGRGGGALRKVGAVQEGVLRKSLLRDGGYLDQALYTILGEEWRAQGDRPRPIAQPAAQRARIQLLTGKTSIAELP